MFVEFMGWDEKNGMKKIQKGPTRP